MSWQGQISDMFNGSSGTGSSGTGMDWRSIFAGGLGGIGQLLGGLFGQHGANDMSQYLQKGSDALNTNFNQGLGYLMPYNTEGLAAMSQYNNALGNMANPTGYVNNIMNQYKTSPMAQFQSQEMQRAANNASAAGGQLGSPAEQMAMSRYQQGITSQDQQNYLNNVMGVNNQYLQGLQGLTGMGYGAAGDMNQNRMGLGSDLANMYTNMGIANMMGNQSMGSGLGGLFGGVASGILGHFGF